MKFIGLYLALVFYASCAVGSQDAFEGVYKVDNQDVHQLWIFVDGYSSTVLYKDKAYVGTFGGPYELEGDRLTVQIEYDDQNPSEIGKEKRFQLEFKGIDFTDNFGMRWTKQKSITQDLDGLWEITGRVKDDKFVAIEHSGGRKTVKLLKDGHFQWIAIDPEEKKFYGTGGGDYTFEDGKYTEHIVFFSRDDSRVGAELSFDGEVKDGDWHHSGKSSKGDPIHEVWKNPES